MINPRTMRAAVLLAILAAPPALAQRAGTVELGAFANYSIFDKKLQLENKLGVAGLAGVYLFDNLALEGDITYVKTHFTFADGGDVVYRPLSARLVYNAPLSPSATLLVGGGYQRSIYDLKASATNPEKRTIGHNAATGLLGLRFGLAPNLYFRADYTIAYHPKSGDFASATAPDNATTTCDPNNPLHPCPDRPPCPCHPGVANGTGRDSYINHGIRAGLVWMPSFHSRTREVIPTPPPSPYVPPPTPPRVDTVPTTRVDTVYRTDTVMRSIPIQKRPVPAPPSGIPLQKEPRPVPIRKAPTGQARNVPPSGEVIVELTEVYFRPNSAELSSGGVDTLTRVVESLVAHPDVSVELSGHSDSSEARTGAVQLSRRRVETVHQFMLSHGVAANRMSVAWYGSARPVGPNTSAEGRARNRRVEIRRTR